MKKVLLSLVALLAFSASAMAQTTADVSASDNAIYVPGGVYPVGKEIIVPIKIKNAINAQGCQIYVTLQEGLSFVAEESDPTTIKCDVPATDHVAMSNVDNGMVVMYSPKNTLLPEIFVLLHLTTASDLPLGEYTIKVDRIRISNADAGREIAVDDNFVSTILLTSGDLILDEDAESFPVSSYTGNVTVKRTLKKDKWNTISLPFNVTKAEFPEFFGEGSAVATFDGWEPELTEEGIPANITIKFKERSVTSTNVLLNGTPYLIKPTKDISEITKTSVTVTNTSRKDVARTFTDEEVTGETYNGLFVSTYAKTKVPADDLFIRDEEFYYSQGETIIKGFRGYFDLGLILNQDPSAGIKMQIVVDGETTDVEGLQIKNTNGAVYSIDGKKMGNNVERLQKGVYIIDGKKVAIK